MDPNLFVAGDVGGTKTDLAVYSVGAGLQKPLTQAIVEAANAPGQPSLRCQATVETLTAILASEAGNLALKVLATGGVYLAGGVALHLLDALKQPRFIESFTRKGRFKELMGRIPMHVITSRAALAGAATNGLELLRNEERR